MNAYFGSEIVGFSKDFFLPFLLAYLASGIEAPSKHNKS